jgi:hypothetical protein
MIRTRLQCPQTKCPLGVAMSTPGQLVKIAIGPRLAERTNMRVFSHPVVVGFALPPHVLGVEHINVRHHRPAERGDVSTLEAQSTALARTRIVV